MTSLTEINESTIRILAPCGVQDHAKPLRKAASPPALPAPPNPGAVAPLARRRCPECALAFGEPGRAAINSNLLRPAAKAKNKNGTRRCSFATFARSHEKIHAEYYVHSHSHARSITPSRPRWGSGGHVSKSGGGQPIAA